MKRKKIGETLTAGRGGKLEYVLVMKVKSKEDRNTFVWGSFPSKRKAIDYIKKRISNHPKIHPKIGSESFDCWIIHEMIRDSSSIENSNSYDYEGNEVCHKGAVLKNG